MTGNENISNKVIMKDNLKICTMQLRNCLEGNLYLHIRKEDLKILSFLQKLEQVQIKAKVSRSQLNRKETKLDT